jgi:hypothetical protein
MDEETLPLPRGVSDRDESLAEVVDDIASEPLHVHSFTIRFTGGSPIE